MLSIASIFTAVIHLALFVTGVVLALTLRRSDPRAGLLAALGFGCQIVSLVVWVVGPMLLNSMFGYEQAMFQVAQVAINAVGRLIEIAGFALIFVALLRRVRAPRAAMGVRP